MSKKPKSPTDAARGKLKRRALAIGLIVGLAFSMLMGITAGARGFGSIYPQMNLIAKPFVCPGGEMGYARNVSDIGTATYYSATWSCEDPASGMKGQIDSASVFVYAGLLYGLIIFAVLVLITHLYWNSSIGPAKNGGPELW